jgi:16S rRNA (guanine527-N7)-methyltransferase
MPDRAPGRLIGVLEEARARGFLGPGPVDRHYTHAADLARAIGTIDGRVLDLGSGGGLPGLVLFELWPGASGALLDAEQRRCDFLALAIETLALSDRVQVRCGRAEALAREPTLRASFDMVVARSFGRPAVTAECAAGFLRRGGELVVTEPPGDRRASRWDVRGLRELGFGAPVRVRAGETGAVRISLESDVDARWPRRVGVPSKRPVW